MKKLSVLLLMATFILTGVSTIMAQSDDLDDQHTINLIIPELALLDLETTGAGLDIDVEATAPTEAGLPIDFSAENEDLWLNYSSIAKSDGYTRTVSAEVSGTVPTYLEINLEVADDAGNGGGDVGDVVNYTTSAPLPVGPTQVISGIGSCYTGDGNTAGHKLTYQIDLSPSGDYSDLVAGSNTITVTYTLSDV